MSGADRLRGLGVGAAEQANEVAAAALGVLDQAQALADERADDRLGRKRPPAASSLSSAAMRAAFIGIEAAAEHRLDERVLRAEVVVHRGEVDAGLGGEQAHRGAFEAVQHEELFGGVEDAGAGFVLAA